MLETSIIPYYIITLCYIMCVDIQTVNRFVCNQYFDLVTVTGSIAGPKVVSTIIRSL